jgi:hypothetical protein
MLLSRSASAIGPETEEGTVEIALSQSAYASRMQIAMTVGFLIGGIFLAK